MSAGVSLGRAEDGPPLKVLHVTPFYEPAWSYGGMARASAGLCRALARRGHEVVVATARLDEEQPLSETRDGVKVWRFPGPELLARLLVPWGRGLGRFLRDAVPSAAIVHLHGHRNGFAVAAQGALSARPPWILQTHGTYPHHDRHGLAKSVFDRSLGDRIVAAAHRLVAVSEAEARDLPRPACVVPNGVEAGERMTRPPRSPRPRLLFVGNDAPQKRGRLLPALLRALPDATLRLVGRFGPPFLESFGPCAGRVASLGTLTAEALAAEYAAADLLVHPAVGEAFGLVPFEAALQGTASVVAGGHGCGEWYGRAGGCVVSRDDLEALVEAVRVRLRDPARAAEEASGVAEFTRAELTWEGAARRFESLYRELLKGRERGAA